MLRLKRPLVLHTTPLVLQLPFKRRTVSGRKTTTTTTAIRRRCCCGGDAREKEREKERERKRERKRPTELLLILRTERATTEEQRHRRRRRSKGKENIKTDANDFPLKQTEGKLAQMSLSSVKKQMWNVSGEIFINWAGVIWDFWSMPLSYNNAETLKSRLLPFESNVFLFRWWLKSKDSTLHSPRSEKLV